MQLYSQQEEALKALRNFVESDISVFILKGYAGTGKTTMINIFCKELSKYNKCVKLMAPTGRAAKVLREKTGRDVTTIHKAIYRKKKFEVVWHDDEEEIKSRDEQNTKVDDMDIYFGINQISDTNEAKNTLIIVDESSLISSKSSNQELIHFGTDILINDLLTYAQLQLGSKILFVGDPAQLPPVGDNSSCALDEDFFYNKNISVSSFTLTEIVRQKSDSYVLRNAMKVRSLLESDIRNELSFDTKAGQVEAVSSIDVVNKYVNMFPVPELNQSVVICYSNSKAQDYNQIIRKLYFETEELHKGDILQVVRNNYNIQVASGELMNGDFIHIISEPDNVEIRNVPLWVNRNGKCVREHIELQFQNIEFETDRGEVGKSKILTTLLDNNRPSLTREESVALYVDFVIRHSSMNKNSLEFEQALMSDQYFNAIQAKYGYAITGHKSQGGEWHTVFVDYTGRTGLDNDSLRWNYTATTRASQCLFGVNFPDISPFNKFSISTIQKVSKIQTDVMCIKDSDCEVLPPTAMPFQKAKYNSVSSALLEHNCKVQSVLCKQYRDRYTIEGPFGQKDFDCLYNGSGIYTEYHSLQPSEVDGMIMKALMDERCYEYDYEYTPSIDFLGKLYNTINSVTDETDVKITGIKEFQAQYYVLYGLRTSATFATLQFYYNNKGFITRCMAASALGDKDEKLNRLITRINELTCQQ